MRTLQTMGEALRRTAPEFRQSILQDAERGWRLEVNETLVHTLHLAAMHHVSAPTLELSCRVLRTLDRVARAQAQP